MESVTSTNYRFRHDGERRSNELRCLLIYRYHGIVENPYPFPNDEEEVVRLDKLQYLHRLLMPRNVMAPISRKPNLILDLGTGSGIIVFLYI